MAGTTTRKASTSKKSETTAKAETSKAKSADATEDLIKTLMAQIEEQNKKMEEMQNQLNSANTTNITVDAVTDEAKLRGRQFKIINLMHCILNVSTQPDGKGRVFTFNKYGDSHRVRFDDLCDIVASYPYTVENGLIYIADKDMVNYLGLAESYEKIYDKPTVDKVTLLKTEEDVDMFVGMEENLQESTAVEIAKRINANENVDLNNVNRIKVECGIDIVKIAEDLKANSKKKED